MKMALVLFITSKNMEWGMFMEIAEIDGTMVESPPWIEIDHAFDLDLLLREFMEKRLLLKAGDYTFNPFRGYKDMIIDNPKTKKTETCDPHRYAVTITSEAKPNLWWRDIDGFVHHYVWCNGEFYTTPVKE